MLKELNLSNNEIGAEGAAALTEALKVNCTLKELDLDGNNIGAEGSTALAEALKVNCTLTELYLHMKAMKPTHQSLRSWVRERKVNLLTQRDGVWTIVCGNYKTLISWRRCHRV